MVKIWNLELLLGMCFVFGLNDNGYIWCRLKSSYILLKGKDLKKKEYMGSCG